MWLSTAGRIISGETECATEFWFGLEGRSRTADQAHMDEVRVIYSSSNFAGVAHFVERLQSIWRQPANTDAFDDELSEWHEAKRQQREVAFRYEWHFRPPGGDRQGIRVLQIETRVKRAAKGWRAEVTLSNSLLGAALR